MKWDGPIESRPTVSMDRFSQGRPDPQDAEPLGRCDGCGREIYPGALVHVFDGDIIHASYSCLRRYFNLASTSIEEVNRP